MKTYDLMEKQILYTDYSGVIADDRPVVAEANSRMLVRRGLRPITFDEWQRSAASSAFTFIQRWGFLDEDEPKVQAEYARTYQEVYAEGKFSPRLLPGADLYFRTRIAEGRTNIIVSSHPASALARELESYGIAWMFADIVGDVGNKGTMLQKLLNCRAPRTVCYAGDMVPDIRAAQFAGITSIGVATGYHDRATLQEARPDILVDSLEELNGHFRGIFANT